jgi:hypothetical protein
MMELYACADDTTTLRVLRRCKHIVRSWGNARLVLGRLVLGSGFLSETGPGVQNRLSRSYRCRDGHSYGHSAPPAPGCPPRLLPLSPRNDTNAGVHRVVTCCAVRPQRAEHRRSSLTRRHQRFSAIVHPPHVLRLRRNCPNSSARSYTHLSGGCTGHRLNRTSRSEDTFETFGRLIPRPSKLHPSPMHLICHADERISQ